MLTQLEYAHDAVRVCFKYPNELTGFDGHFDATTPIGSHPPCDPILDLWYRGALQCASFSPNQLFNHWSGLPYKESRFSNPPTENYSRLPKPSGQRTLSIIKALLSGDTTFGLHQSTPDDDHWQTRKFRKRNSDVSHVTPVGRVVLNDQNTFWRPAEDLYSVPANKYTAIVLDSSAMPTTWEPDFLQYFPECFVSLLDYYRMCEQLPAGMYIDQLGQCKMYLDSLHMSFTGPDPSRLEYKYHWTWTEWYTPFIFRVSAHSYVNISYSVKRATAVPNGEYYLGGIIHPLVRVGIYYTVDYKVKDIALAPYEPVSYTPYEQIRFPHYHEFSLDDNVGVFLRGGQPGETILNGFSRVESYDPETQEYDASIYVAINRHAADVFAETRNIHLLSGKKAIDLALAGVEVDNLQNIFSGVPNLSGYISDLTEAWMCYQRIVNGDIVGGGLEFVDLLTNVYLLLKFEIIPNYSDAVNFVTHIKPIIASLKSGKYFGTAFSGRGVAHYQLPSEGFGLLNNQLLAGHTLVTFSLSDTALVHALLPFKLLGLLTPLSSAWAVQKFSFLVDWVTNIGGKLRIADSQLFALCLDVSGSVSSSVITWDIPSDVLIANGLRVIETPGIRLYERVVEEFLPTYYPTHLDLQPASDFSSTKWKLLGCLAWQLLKLSSPT